MPTSKKATKELQTGGPGFWMGIISIIGAILFQPVGLVCGILGIKESSKAGYKNNFALAGIIISSILLVLEIIGLVIILSTGSFIFNKVNKLPNRPEVINSIQEEAESTTQSAQEIIDAAAAASAQTAAEQAAAQAAANAAAIQAAADQAAAEQAAAQAAAQAAVQAALDAARARLNQ